MAHAFDELYIGLVSLETTTLYEGIRELILDFPFCVVVVVVGDGGGNGTCSNTTKLYCDTAGGVKIMALMNACVAYTHAELRVNYPV